MEQFFGIPIARAGVAIGASFALLVGVLLALGGRGAPLVRLGARNLPRRPARAILIVCGLTLSTTVISSAFGTGDTITSTLRSLVTQTLGTTDEAIVLNPPRISNGDRARALANGTFGGLKASDLGFFPQREFEQLRERVRGSGAIAALAPAIADQVTLVLGEEQQTLTAVGLLATTTPDPAAFGALVTTTGAPIALEGFGPDEIALNSAAAGAFGAQVGQTVVIRTRAGNTGAPLDWPATIAAISRDGGIGGAAPLVIAPLATYQRVLGQPEQINQILVANQGGRASVTRTREASGELRNLLVDREAAGGLRAYLARPEVQRGLAEAAGSVRGRDRANLEALRAEATKPGVTDRFVSLATDPRVRRQLFSLASQIPNRADRRAVNDLVRGLAARSVIEVKQEGLDQADEYGNVVTTVFLVLGIFSLGAAILLIHLIFSLLAADRRAELATLRALGLGQRQIMAIFLAEGVIYALLGAALGALAGVVATRLTVASLAEALATFGYQLELRVEPRSILIAFLAGALLTFLAMCASAWRVSHAQIVAGTRGEERAEGRGGTLVAGIAALLVAALIWWRWREPALAFRPPHPLVGPGTLALVVLGVALLAGDLSRRAGAARGERLAGALGTGAGFLLIGIWLRALARLPTPGGDTRADAIAAAIGGLILVCAGVWTATRALGPLLKGLDRALSPLARLRLIVRPAAAYLDAGRWRTALTVTMFGMVVFIMVSALTLIETLVDAYAGNEPPVAGFDLRGDLPATAATAQPLADIEAALAGAPGVRRADFGAIGGTIRLDARIIQLGLPRAAWRDAALVVADDGFLGGIATGFERRARGYADDAAIWRALRDQPGLAVVTGSTASTFATLPGGDGDFAPFTIWAKPTGEGAPIKLTVIGILDPRAELDPGLWLSRATAGGLGVALAPPTAYYFALAPGTVPQRAIEGLKVSFADRSLVVTDLGNTIRIGRSIRALLTQLVQGFMGLGLIAGVTALGIVGIQSVIERRQQLGTLRALGFTRGQTRATLAFESATVAALGIGLGTALGLILARSLVALLAVRAPEVRYTIPWDQIAVTLALAWLGTLGALTIAAWQAGRVAPADALRATG